MHEEELLFPAFDHHDVSGLSSDDDHQLVVDSIREYLRTAAG
ncbi:hypothetical protein [Arthrobacter globiformis]|nr:hypothetical protein [Arthrobacter globiformis]MDQ0616903.1 uncharacterized protein (UPF0303 family) [Arthrobacter globiformis]